MLPTAAPSPQIRLDRAPPWVAWAVVGVTVLGVGIRWRFLDHPMRYDESYNFLHYASKSPSFIATHYVPNNHVLHTLMVHFASRVLGTHPQALRLPAFIAGVLLIPATGWMAWRMSRRGLTAVLAAAAVCGSSALVEYSANARGYSLLALFTVIGVGLALGLLEAPQQRWGWVGLGLVAALGAYAVPVMILPFAGLAAMVLVGGVCSSPPVLRGWSWMVSTAGLGVAALYSPIVLREGFGKLFGGGELAYEVLGRQIHSFGEVVSGAWQLWSRDSRWGWQLLVACGLAVHALTIFRRANVKAWLPISTVLVALLLAAATRAPLPARTWLFALPIVLTCAVSGLCGLAPRGVAGTHRRILAFAPVALAIFVVASPLLKVPFESRLCSERGGLVEVDDALGACHAFGARRCAVVAPYNPALAYYMIQRGMDQLAEAVSPRTERVFVVTTEAQSLSDLWHPGIRGFERFDPPRPFPLPPTGRVYLAERRDLSTASR